MSFPRPALLVVLLTLAVAASMYGCASRQRAHDGPNPDGNEHVLTLLFVADLHAQIEEHPELFWNEGTDEVVTAGGFARLSQAIRDERSAAPGDVLVIDGGDTFQGSSVAALTEGRALLPLVEALGIDLSIPGNWEVAYGPQTMQELLSSLSWPVIATNIHDASTGDAIFESSWLTEASGLRIGFVGYTDPDVPFRQPPTYSEGLRYSGADGLNDEAIRLREAGAELVILVSHIGLSKAVELSERLEGFDFHLSSDTHERTYEPIDVKGVWVVEPGAFGSFLGKLVIHMRDGIIVDKRWELLEIRADRWEEAPDVRHLVDEVLAPWRPLLDEPIGELHDMVARYDVVETTLDNILSDALRAATGAEIALSNGFRFGTPLLPGTIHASSLYDFYPIVTALKTGEVSGRQLREFWERELENVFAQDASKRFGGWVPRPSGMTLRFLAHAPAGQRIQEILINGVPLDDDRVYTITACEREGDPDHMICRIPHARNTRVHTLDAHEAVRAYLRANPGLRAPTGGRVQALDLPAEVRSQHFAR